MAFVTRILKVGAFLALLLAIAISIVFHTSIPTRLGLYRWWAENANPPSNIGFTPATLYGVPWKYTFEEFHKTNLTGQTALVTGANSGIGYELTLALTQQGAQVTMACRNPTKCEAAAESIRKDAKFQGKVETMTMDTSSLASVKSFGEAYASENDALDMLFLNAGTVFTDLRQKCVPLSKDGIETVFASNYLGHFLLYRLLEPLLFKSKLARVVLTSSNGSFYTYSYKVATNLETLNGCSESFSRNGIENLSYGQSKLAQILFAQALTKRLGPDATIYVNSFHPGMVSTKIWDLDTGDDDGAPLRRRIMDWLRSEVMWTGADGALTGLFLGAATDRLVKENIRGKYFHPPAIQVNNELANNDTLEKELWEFSESLVRDYLETKKPLAVEVEEK